MAEEREVVARLKTERTGETGAFREAADDVRELKTEAESAAPALEGLGEAADEAGVSAEKAGGGLSEVGEKAEGAGRGLSSMRGQAVLAGQAFKAGYEIGSLLRDVLNDLSQGGFDRGIQDIVTSALGLEEGLDSDADAAQRLMNQMRILKANGIDPVGLSAAEVEKKVEELTKAKNESRKAAEELTKAEEEWAVKLGISGKSLDEGSKKLAQYVSDFARQNDQLSNTDLGKIFGPMIQDILDNYALLGKQPPAEVKKLADQWNVLTTAAEKAKDEQKKIVDEMVSDIQGAVKGLSGSLQSQVATLSEVLSKIDFGSLNSEGLEKARSLLQQFVDTSHKAGQQIPADIADQAAALGILVPAMEVAGEANSGLRGTQDELREAVVGTSQAVNAQGQALTQHRTITNQAGAAAKAASGQIKEGGEEISETGPPIRNVTAEITKMVTELRGAGSAGRSAGEGVKEGATKAGEGAASLKEAGSAGAEAGTGLSAAKTAAEGLGPAAAEVKTGVDGMKSSLEGVGPKASAAATGLQSLNDVDLSKTDIALAGILAKLDAIPGKASAAKAALENMDGGNLMPVFSNTLSALDSMATKLDTVREKADAVVPALSTTRRAVEESQSTFDALAALMEKSKETQNNFSKDFELDMQQVRLGSISIEEFIRKWADAKIATVDGFRTIREEFAGTDMGQYRQEIQDLITAVTDGGAKLSDVVKFLKENTPDLAKGLINVLELFQQGKASLDDVQRVLDATKQAFPGGDAGGLIEAIRNHGLEGEE